MATTATLLGCVLLAGALLTFSVTHPCTFYIFVVPVLSALSAHFSHA